MNRFKVIGLYLMVIFIMGCAAKKNTYRNISTKVTDTLILKTEVIKAPVLNSTLVVKELCDSITGKPKPFQQTFVVGKDTVFINIVDNELLLNIDILEKEILRRDSVLRTSSKEVIDVSKKVTVRYRWARITWIFLSIIVVFIVFPKIPQSIRTLAEKLIVG